MRLSLLRAPKAPDANADIGRHTFRYGFFPHAGALGPATVHAASNFNNPLEVQHAPTANVPRIESLLQTVSVNQGSSIILDAVKRGEDDEDVSRGELPARAGRSIILRFYESLGGKSSARIKVDLPIKKVFKTNLLEDDLEELPFESFQVNGHSSTSISLNLRAFEVATYRLQL